MKLNIVDGDKTKTLYFGRIGFFHYPKDSSELGYLTLKSYILIESNAKDAVSKLQRILKSEQSYYTTSKQTHISSGDDYDPERIEVETDCVGIVNFEQIEETFVSGVDIFQEVISHITRDDAYEGVESDDTLKKFIEEETQKGKIPLYNAEYLDT